MDREGKSIISQHIDPSYQERAVERYLRIRQEPTEQPLSFTRIYGFQFQDTKPPGHENCRISILSRADTHVKDRVIMEPGMYGTAGIISVKPRQEQSLEWSRIRWLKVGFDDEFRPVILIMNSQHQE